MRKSLLALLLASAAVAGPLGGAAASSGQVADDILSYEVTCGVPASYQPYTVTATFTHRAQRELRAYAILAGKAIDSDARWYSRSGTDTFVGSLGGPLGQSPSFSIGIYRRDNQTKRLVPTDRVTTGPLSC